MTIDDILDKALSPEHGRTAAELQEYISNIRVPLLIDFFKQGMTPADRAAFEHLPIQDQAKQLQDKHYMLKPDLAEKFVNYLSVAVLKRISTPMGSQLETAIARMNDATLSVNDRHAAAVEVEHLHTILHSYGFNPAEMIEKGRKEGFSPQLWNDSLKNLGEYYRIKQQNAAMALVTPDQAEHYLTTTVNPATGLKVTDVKAEGIAAMKSVALLFRQYQKGGDVEGFKKQMHQYH
ncbi:hypothetical protein HYU17_04500 [Candidatus Woesearchaeota archaeon]|nr:hypothetical protein [Candidatus Woesearchaeota archaeon]